ncbi:hypothetical protein [Enterococcus caccae]|uniref:Uncharacterized protein n=1 Tax=Enterococcus caccae ATCC BAA-1240 TaxID=1158612 RepID=R3WRP0_9ENTE|nr:hypothetical protein [Enterococcus caccae]EOL44475.1 hypothetical protein UC7_02519 [Enterococcus caccae ATCC BAA-1240]EOT68409.1 hypothetical protein I580_00792 [Enterococcus caccae ATCC BAA-1240]
MFITFGMFIGLIILTIIMIVAIIYLTFTGGNKQHSRHKNVHQAQEAAKQLLAQNDNELSRRSQHSTSFKINQETDFRQQSSRNDPQQDVDIDEVDDSLHVLPYPKDNKFE